MGEDSIILPIDRVISEDIEGTRYKSDKCGYKLIKYNKRKFSVTSCISLRRLIIEQVFYGFRNYGIKLAGLISCVLIISGCYLMNHSGRDSESGELRMQDDYAGLSQSVDALEDRANAQLHEDDLETIRRSIVEGLGLERIPDPSKANVSQTEYERAHVEYLRRLQMSRAPGDRRRRRLHTFYATDEMDQLLRTKRDLSNNHVSTHSLYFPLDITEQDEQVDHATLRLILEPTPASDLVDVSIYQIAETSRHLISSATFSHVDRARWIELDVTELVVQWHEAVIDNLGLEVRLNAGLDANISLTSPVLNVFSTIDEQFRRRRSAPDHLMSLHKGRRTECRGDNKKCCRHEMTVIFKDLKGFEFIVQPKTFDAGYCKGRCPPRYNPAHHHALLQSLIWKEDKRKAPRPCCAPSKLAELEILYFDENNPTKLKVSSWKNMRVLECACS